jgi:hypothetical protein
MHGFLPGKAALLAAAAVVSSAMMAHAGDWTADTSVGCRVWNPNPQPGETVRWSGACVNGLAQGHGAAQWFRNDLPFESDEGEWREGRQSGYGSQVWPLGRYDGQFADSEPYGQGVMIFQSVKYDGQFRNGKPNGLGTLTNGTGVFSGYWTDGCLREGAKRASFGVPLSACR